MGGQAQREREIWRKALRDGVSSPEWEQEGVLYSPLQMWEVRIWQWGGVEGITERMGRPHLWDRLTFHTFSWGTKERSPYPRFRELLDNDFTA